MLTGCPTYLRSSSTYSSVHTRVGGGGGGGGVDACNVPSFSYNNNLTTSFGNATGLPILSNIKQSLHQLLVGRSGEALQPCLEHLSSTCSDVSTVVLLDYI